MLRVLWSTRHDTFTAPGPATGPDLSEDLVRRCEEFTRGRRELVRQQTGTTCGPNTLAMFRALTDPAYLPRAVHQRDVGRWGCLERRLQQTMSRGAGTVPWPTAWGTLPWALARQLQLLTGGRWTVRRADPLAAGRVQDLLVAGGRWCRAGLPLPLYVGNDRLPRHVVLLLAVDPRQTLLYDPALGGVCRPVTADLVAGRAPVAGWRRVWCLLTPPGRPGR